jgi:hypothetical protein
MGMTELPILFSAPMVRAILAGRKTQTRRLLDLRRSVGTPETADGCLLQLWYPGAKLHYGYTPTFRSHGPRNSWQVERLCGPACEPSPKGVYPPTGHVDWAGPVDVDAGRYPGPYDGRHPVSWGPLRFWPGLRLWVKETFWTDGTCCSAYRADTRDDLDPDEVKRVLHVDRWKPAIYMPRPYSRITLEVTGVRIERLQDISESDARAEGVQPIAFGDEAPGRTTFAELWNRLNEDKAPWKSNPWVSVVTFQRVSP